MGKENGGISSGIYSNEIKLIFNGGKSGYWYVLGVLILDFACSNDKQDYAIFELHRMLGNINWNCLLNYIFLY